MPDEWLSAREAASYLQVHPKTLYRYARAGALKASRLGSTGRPRYSRADLDRLLAGRIAGSGRDAASLRGRPADAAAASMSPITLSPDGGHEEIELRWRAHLLDEVERLIRDLEVPPDQRGLAEELLLETFRTTAMIFSRLPRE